MEFKKADCRRKELRKLKVICYKLRRRIGNMWGKLKGLLRIIAMLSLKLIKFKKGLISKRRKLSFS